MAGYFEEDDEPELEEPQRDTEVTLTWGAVLGMGAALLLLCGLCFGLGFMAGHRGSATAAGAASGSQPGASDQAPLQGSGSVPKPSASAQAPTPLPAPVTESAPAAPAAGGESPDAVAPGSAPGPAQGIQAQGTQGGSQASLPAGTTPASAQVRPALGGNSPESAPPAATTVHPALPSAASLMVQGAAVKNPEDASVLTNALRRRGYPVSTQRDAGDGLIHVRIGPFANRGDAYRWRDKLLGDGYNAIVQP